MPAHLLRVTGTAFRAATIRLVRAASGTRLVSVGHSPKQRNHIGNLAHK